MAENLPPPNSEQAPEQLAAQASVTMREVWSLMEQKGETVDGGHIQFETAMAEKDFEPAATLQVAPVLAGGRNVLIVQMPHFPEIKKVLFHFDKTTGEVSAVGESGARPVNADELNFLRVAQKTFLEVEPNAVFGESNQVRGRVQKVVVPEDKDPWPN